MALSKYDIQLDLERVAGSSHAHLVELVGVDHRVLDVGCDTGYLGEVLNTLGNDTTGFEINDETAAEARTRLARVEVGDLERIDLVEVFGPGSFDVVVFGDVLEHLRDPLPVLRRSRELLAPGGSVIISTPNVAHGDVRLALLAGRWDYRSLGILDVTHTRFFTRDSLVQFVEDAGFVLTELRRTLRPLFDTEIGVDEAEVDPAVVARLQDDTEATTYQFVVRIVPAGETDLTSARALDQDAATTEKTRQRGVRAGDIRTLGVEELRHRLLTSRDFAIGAEAAAGQLRARAGALHAKVDQLWADLQESQASAEKWWREALERQDEVAALRRELDEVRTSATFRIGQAAIRPARRWRRGHGSGR